MWKHVLLLGLALERGLGGLGLWGRLGAPIFSPTVRKSSLPGLAFAHLLHHLQLHIRHQGGCVHGGGGGHWEEGECQAPRTLELTETN